jgi:hypothetical protein
MGREYPQVGAVAALKGRLVRTVRQHWSPPLLIPLIAIAMRVASAPTATLSYLVISAFALGGRVQAIQALALSWLFSMLSQGLAPVPNDGSTGRYAVQAAAALSVFFLHRRRSHADAGTRRMVTGTRMLGLFVIIHSMIFSTYTDVSVLKAISWLVSMLTLLTAWASLATEVREAVVAQIFRMMIAIMVASLPLIGNEIGYLTNGTGFQGVLDHPQAFGAVMGMAGAWVGGHLISSPRPSWAKIFLFGLSIALTFLSEARTGLLSLVLGLGMATLTAPLLSGRPLRSVVAGLRSKRLQALAFVAVIAAVASWTTLTVKLEAFMAKRTDAMTLASAYQESRGELMETMISNIQRAPWAGIGFGIASIPDSMVIVRDPVFKLPVSAIIEKGVLPMALWEELGIFGFLGASFWFFLLVRRSAIGGLAPLSLCLTALLQNMGDAMFFSSGGMGLLQLIVVAWCATAATRDVR